MSEIIITLLAIFAFGALYCASVEYLCRAWRREQALLRRRLRKQALLRRTEQLEAQVSELKQLLNS
jgi:peptidoglycan/LPS O-acetylase OafA/YrhL